jgi:hypothetical protein
LPCPSLELHRGFLRIGGTHPPRPLWSCSPCSLSRFAARVPASLAPGQNFRNPQQPTTVDDARTRRVPAPLPAARVARGFQRIRYYGFLTNSKRGALLPLCRRLIARVHPSRTIVLPDDEPARTGWSSVPAAAAGCASSSASPLPSCAPACHLLSPPHDATPHPTSNRSRASAYHVLLCLGSLLRPFRPLTDTSCAAESYVGLSDERSKALVLGVLCASKPSRSALPSPPTPESNRIDLQSSLRAAFKSLYRWPQAPV